MVSVERRSAVRHTRLAREMSLATGGQSYDLTNVANLLKDFQPKPKIESSIKVIALWHNWLAFAIVILLMLGEWLARHDEPALSCGVRCQIYSIITERSVSISGTLIDRLCESHIPFAIDFRNRLP